MKLVLIACLLGAAVASPLPGKTGISLLPVSSFIKGLLSTDYGFQQVKTYIQSLRSDDPDEMKFLTHGKWKSVNGKVSGRSQVAVVIRKGFESHSDEEWKEIIKAFFKNTPTIAVEPGFQYPQLPELFEKVKTALSTDEGIEIFKKYLHALDTSNEVLQGIVARLLSKDNSALKFVFSVLFSGISRIPLYTPYDIKQDLEETVTQIKATVLKADGLALVRKIISNVKSVDKLLVFIKTVLPGLPDHTLITLVKEISKNIPDEAIDLEGLLRKAKDLVVTDDGLAYLREYFDDLKTGNFLIIRFKNILKAKTDEEVKADVIYFWKEIFGE